MDIKSGKPYPSNALSNFAPHPFYFKGVLCNSMEGLLQSLKFKDPNMQKEICKYVGIKAKKAGSKKNWREKQVLYWQGYPIDRHSDGYQRLLDEAYEALFTQNEKAKKALLATGDANLTHNIGHTSKKETILTRSEFCSRLMKIRKDLKKKEAARDSMFDEDINALADAVVDEIQFMSSINQITSNSKYKQIVNYGWEAVPYLVEWLETKPCWWFSALNEITGVDPVKEENKGNYDVMKQEWIDWYVKEFYSSK